MEEAGLWVSKDANIAISLKLFSFISNMNDFLDTWMLELKLKEKVAKLY